MILGMQTREKNRSLITTRKTKMIHSKKLSKPLISTIKRMKGLNLPLRKDAINWLL